MKEVSLYECSNAKVGKAGIYCTEGVTLNPAATSGCLRTLKLARGEPLVLTVCQSCQWFDRNGDSLPACDRGWYKKEVSK